MQNIIVDRIRYLHMHAHISKKIINVMSAAFLIIFYNYLENNGGRNW